MMGCVNEGLAYSAAEAICRRHAKSFYFASHFLPDEKRRRAYAVYAFCRLLDDAVDEASTPEQMETQLARFETLLAECYAGTPVPGTDEAALALGAFAATVRDCAIPMKPFLELADGCRMDLTVRRYPDWPELEKYCYRVAGVVGLIMCYVFGLRNTHAHQRAIAMGNAMQLTNILRDVGEDYGRGRIYLPQDEMLAFGVSERDIDERRATRAFRDLIRYQIDRARALYAQGCEGLCAIPTDGSRQTACVMATVYGGILGAIERMDCDVFAGRAHLGLFGKLARIPAAMRLSRLEHGDQLSGLF